MEVELIRTYFPDGTNGEVYHAGTLVCHAIELPWRDNEESVSCIPEGKYALAKRYHPHYGWHLHVQDVPQREWILIHPATEAQLHLKGCIAPVSVLTGPGKGSASRIAHERLRALVYAVIEKEQVYLIVKPKKLTL